LEARGVSEGSPAARGKSVGGESLKPLRLALQTQPRSVDEFCHAPKEACAARACSRSAKDEQQRQDRASFSLFLCERFGKCRAPEICHLELSYRPIFAKEESVSGKSYFGCDPKIRHRQQKP
jgi:hypothetical protein